MYARLFLCDLFIHGIGGGKYDEVTDNIIRRYYGVEPPAYLVLSATLHLPLPHHPARPEDCRRLRRQGAICTTTRSATCRTTRSGLRRWPIWWHARRRFFGRRRLIGGAGASALSTDCQNHSHTAGSDCGRTCGGAAATGRMRSAGAGECHPPEERLSVRSLSGADIAAVLRAVLALRGLRYFDGDSSNPRWACVHCRAPVIDLFAEWTDEYQTPGGKRAILAGDVVFDCYCCHGLLRLVLPLAIVGPHKAAAQPDNRSAAQVAL